MRRDGRCLLIPSAGFSRMMEPRCLQSLLNVRQKITCYLDAKKDSFLNKQGSCIKKGQLPGLRSNKQAAEEAEAAFLSHHAVEIYGARGKSWPNFLQAALNRPQWSSHS